MIDPITDGDLTAYIDGQLDVMRRLEVEAHLAANPATAARVMAELHDRDALRAAFAQLPGPGPERNRHAARRIDRSMRWRRVGARLKRAAAIAVMVGAGWLAHDEVGRFGVPGTIAAPVDPTLIEDAQQARQVAQMRARVASQRSGSTYDRAAIEAATGIQLPSLPESWTVRDVQIFPARHGTGVEIIADAASLGEISLFATHRRGNGPLNEIANSGDGTTVYWNAGKSAYALSGNSDEATLRATAARIAAASL
ncbi:anti-sigma factor [Methylobacterium gregans]|uniref:anti-sigma factor n=2 Tax=Methylobacterium gregans TaxID=374424 RepID=UPI00235C9B0B|nr:anti-sigma factor [Methylobacterium gregans]MDQ0522646.1 anti-sigma factor RsiW [Methylobacterium gregans]GLS56824.1 transcriptional regulator, anti-sigma factor [Methylobacterium gregans]